MICRRRPFYPFSITTKLQLLTPISFCYIYIEGVKTLLKILDSTGTRLQDYERVTEKRHKLYLKDIVSSKKTNIRFL